MLVDLEHQSIRTGGGGSLDTLNSTSPVTYTVTVGSGGAGEIPSYGNQGGNSEWW